ncbi:MAG: relaxase domain-containing protein [Phycisphaerales bacterium]|nr:relaxase domain-containing protein [Phycisphaerales bacterium]
MTPFKSAAAMKAYFTKALRGEYYSHEAERTAFWHGKAADRLGILGFDITDAAFKRLAENQRPDGSGRLTARTRADRTPGYDITFSAPKGVSVLHAIAKDERIVDAFQAAVRDTMNEIEQRAMTRVRVQGQDTDRVTGNLVWGEFIHTTTRPVDGLPDPHLHAHCVVFNTTFDAGEDRFKAGQFREIKRDMPYYQAAFDARLAARLTRIGYATQRTDKGWDLAGMENSLCEKFSRRTREIDELAERMHITDPARKAELGAKSRKNKSHDLSRAQLEARWGEQLTREERDAIQSVAAGRARSRDPAITAEEALDRAIAHRFERESVVPLPRLLEAALVQSVGQVTPEEMRRQAARSRELLTATIGHETHVTTRRALAEEKAMIAFARDGRGLCPPLEAGRTWDASATALNKGQRAAVGHILTSRDRVMLVRGGAGTGKTTLMRAAVAAIESRGKAVIAVAPTSQAARGVLRESGFAGADTLQALLSNPARQAACRNGVIWCDEAGLVSTGDMNRLFEMAGRQNARVLLTGDSKQHAPVQRGDALRLLESHSGLRPAEVLTVVRQQGVYKRAVEAISKGRFDLGMRLLDTMNAVHEISDGMRPVRIARDYAGITRAGQSCLVVAPTHAEGELLTDLIRAELRRDGRLGERESVLARYRDLNWTQGQKRDAVRYQVGHVVRFHQDVKGFKRGQAYRVVAIGPRGEVRVESAVRRTKVRTLPIDKPDAFGIYAEQPLRVARGDLLRVTRNGRTQDGTHRLNNGSVYRVAGFTKDGHVRLDNGWVMPRDFAHVAHGYCSTSHAAQGRSVDRVLLSQPWSTVAAGSAEQWYVSVSRGKHGLSVYTDDRSALVESMSRISQRRSAIEVTEASRTNTPLSRILENSFVLRRLKKYEHLRAKQHPRRARGISRGFVRGR